MIVSKIGENPFIVGRKFDDGSFIDREYETKRILNEVTQSGNIVVYGSRRLGKTWLIEKVFYELLKNNTAIPLFFDIQRYATLKSFISDFVTTLYKNAFRKGRIDVFLKKYMPNSSIYFSFSIGLMKFELQTQNSEQTLVALRESLSIPELLFKTEPYVIAFDEFQEFKLWDEPIINLFRSQIQQQRHTSYIFSGSQESAIKEMFVSSNSPFFQSMEHLHLNSYLPLDSCKRFLTEKFFNTGKKITPDGVEQILVITEGHPLFMQLLARRSWQNTKKECNAEIVQYSLKEEINNNQYQYNFILNKINNSEQKAVLYLVAQKKVDLFSKNNLLTYQIKSASSMNRALKALIEKDIVEKLDRGKYRLTNLFFKEFLREEIII